MEQYLKIDCLKSEATSLDSFKIEMDPYVEKYDNFIFLTERKNLSLKYTKPIVSLKKLVSEVYSIDFEESKALIIEMPEDILKELFEEEGSVEKEVFVLFKKESRVIDFNR